MIVDFMLHYLFIAVEGILGVFPSLPAMDASIVTAGGWLITLLGEGSAFARELYGAAFLSVLVGIFVAIWAFEPIYHAVMWVIRKIPIIHVS